MPIVTPVIPRDIYVIPTAWFLSCQKSELFVFHSTLNIRNSDLRYCEVKTDLIVDT